MKVFLIIPKYNSTIKPWCVISEGAAKIFASQPDIYWVYRIESADRIKIVEFAKV